MLLNVSDVGCFWVKSSHTVLHRGTQKRFYMVITESQRIVLGLFEDTHFKVFLTLSFRTLATRLQLDCFIVMYQFIPHLILLNFWSSWFLFCGILLTLLLTIKIYNFKNSTKLNVKWIWTKKREVSKNEY